MTASIENLLAATDLILTERRSNVFLIGLDRPDKHNALDQAMVDQLDLALIEARRVPEWNKAGRHAAQQAGFTWVANRVWNHQQYEIFEQPT